MSASRRAKQRNILLIGPSTTTTAFIRNYKQFWKCFNVVHNELQGFLYGLCDRTKEITRSYSNTLDEQLCFVDTSQSMKFYEVRNLHEILSDLNVVDVILVFADNYLHDLELFMREFFIACNYPREKVIFIIYKKYDVNITVTAVNLEEKLKELNLATRIVRNKNLFVEQDVFTANGMPSFSGCLRALFELQPCGFTFTDIPDVLEVISQVFYMLIEVLLNAENVTKRDNCILTFGPKRWTICMQCVRKGASYCHNNCDCLDKSQSEDLLNCSMFIMKTCRLCHCSIEQHVSYKYYTKGTGHFKTREAIELEKNTILHMVATFYLFCKQRSELQNICNNKINEYWSLVRLGTITTDDPVYKEIKGKIKELESNSYHPTPEEVTHLIGSLEKEKWQSFQMTDFIKATSELKLITNVPKSSDQASKSEASRRGLRFPEMKTASPNNALPNDAKDTIKGLIEAVENLRKEVAELRLSVKKEKSEKDRLQNQIDDLKQKIGLQ